MMQAWGLGTATPLCWHRLTVLGVLPVHSLPTCVLSSPVLSLSCLCVNWGGHKAFLGGEFLPQLRWVVPKKRGNGAGRGGGQKPGMTGSIFLARLLSAGCLQCGKSPLSAGSAAPLRLCGW